MVTLLQDLRYGVRMLLKTPVVSTVAALSLALGIAANASTFSILNSFFFHPLPYRDQDGLVVLREGRQGTSIEAYSGVAMANFRDYEAGSPSIASATAYTVSEMNLTGEDVPEQLGVVMATPNFFDVLGVPATLGRTFRPEEGAEGLGNVVVLGHDLWVRRYQEDPGTLGRTLTLDGTVHTIVGVAPEGFDPIPANVDLFKPTDFAAQRDDRSAHAYVALGRLVPGASAQQVGRELDGLFARIASEHPEGNRGWTLRVLPLRKFFPGPTDTKLLLVLSAVTLFGLMIACANVANLLLSRAEERQKEVALRTALGAGRVRILRQLLTESITLGVVAGAAGIVLSMSVVDWLRGAMPAMIPKAMMPELDPTVLAATAAVSVLAGIAFGLAPALHAARAGLGEAMSEGSRGGTVGHARRRLRNAFVVGEFAVALALLSGSSYLMTAFRAVVDADPGYRQQGLLTFSLSIPEGRYPTDADVSRYQDELVEALTGIPGVTDVAMMSTLPRSMMNPGTRYSVEGRDAVDGTELPRAGLQAINPGYLRTLEIPLIEGRAFDGTDRAESQRVALVNEAFVRREFADEDPLGRSLAFRGTTWTIVGVVGDALQDRIALAGNRGEAVYVPSEQLPQRAPSFALRTAAEATELAGDVRGAVWDVDPDQPVASLRTLDAHVAESLAGPRTISLFVGVMGTIALLLAAMGIYGVMAHAVLQQKREIGIRMALGAGRAKVVGMVTRSGMALAGVGMLLGVPVSFLMYRAVASALDLFEGVVGPMSAAGVAVALAGVAALATYLPALRASGIQPVDALRD